MRCWAVVFVVVTAVAGSSTRGTVVATIDAGPTCPVERVGHPCPPEPVTARVEARDLHGRLAGSTRSDARGRFSLKLARGTFNLRVLTGVLPRCPLVTVRVRAGKTMRTAVHCDTGIR
jgi:hypothetical protein